MFIKKISRTLFPLLVFIAIASIAITAHGAECSAEFCPLADVEGTKLAGLYDSSEDGSLATFMSRIFTFAISAGALMAVLRLTYAGYLYMVTDLWTTKGKAIEIIQTTTLGLFLLLAVYLILYQINPQILSLQILFRGGESTSNNSEQQRNLGVPVQPEKKGVFYEKQSDAPESSWCYQSAEGFKCFESQFECIKTRFDSRDYNVPGATCKSLAEPVPLNEEGEITPPEQGEGDYYYERQAGKYCYEAAGTGSYNYYCSANQAQCAEYATAEGKTCSLQSTSNSQESAGESPSEENSSAESKGKFYEQGDSGLFGLYCYSVTGGFQCFTSSNACETERPTGDPSNICSRVF